jgi:hypothetical protein
VVAVLTLIGRLTERALPPVAKPIMLTTSASWLLLLASLSLLGRTGSWSRHGRTVGFICGTAVIALAVLLALPAAGPLMSPQSVTAFMFLGLGLLLLDWETTDGSRPAQAMALLAAVIAFVPLLGYLSRCRCSLRVRMGAAFVSLPATRPAASSRVACPLRPSGCPWSSAG